MKKKLILIKALSITAVSLLFSINSQVFATTQQANVLPALNGFSTNIFTKVASPASGPDDITTMDGNIFVGNQNGVGSEGSTSSTGVLNSNVIEYNATGKQLFSWSITGKCDGLTADPSNHRLIATVNEDGNSSMYIITPSVVASNQVKHVIFKTAVGQTLPSGGTDSIAFQNGNIYISASDPKVNSKGNFTTAALFKAVINSDNTATLTPVLMDNAIANDATPGASAGATTTLNMSDPDSNEIVPKESPKYAGQIALVDQGDSKLIFSKNIGTTSQVNTMLPIGDQIDDIVWATSTKGTLYVTDTSNNKLYEIKGSFAKGTAFVAAPNDSGVGGFVGTIDLTSGIITPIAIGMNSPHGLLFVPQVQTPPSTVYKNKYGTAKFDIYYNSAIYDIAHSQTVNAQKNLAIATKYANLITDNTKSTLINKTYAATFSIYYNSSTYDFSKKDLLNAQNNLNVATSYAYKITDSTITNLLNSATAQQDKIYTAKSNIYYNSTAYDIGHNQKLNAQKNIALSSFYANKVTDSTKARLLNSIAALQAKINLLK